MSPAVIFKPLCTFAKCLFSDIKKALFSVNQLKLNFCEALKFMIKTSVVLLPIWTLWKVKGKGHDWNSTSKM